jgi:hypothetical protein
VCLSNSNSSRTNASRSAPAAVPTPDTPDDAPTAVRPARREDAMPWCGRRAPAVCRAISGPILQIGN